jgi:hypothetical protein
MHDFIIGSLIAVGVIALLNIAGELFIGAVCRLVERAARKGRGLGRMTPAETAEFASWLSAYRHDKRGNP